MLRYKELNIVFRELTAGFLLEMQMKYYLITVIAISIFVYSIRDQAKELAKAKTQARAKAIAEARASAETEKQESY